MLRLPSPSFVRRAFWVTMLAGHAPALARRLTGLLVRGEVDIHLGTALALALATFFFLLKCFDVAWLRLRADRRSCCAVALLIGLVHADVIARSTGDPLQPPQVLILGSSAGLLATVAVLRTAARRGARRACTADLPAPPVWRRLCDLDRVAVPPLERLHAPHTLRAPPIHSC